jgi:effector-binding domain-containing protein
VGIRIDAAVEVSAPLKKDRLALIHVARVIHRGPYEFCRLAYAGLIPRLEEQWYEIATPGAERWLDDPRQTAPEQCRLEVLLPVRINAQRAQGGRNEP